MSYWAIFLAYSITTLILHASFFALQAIHWTYNIPQT
jgi:hypothetical protein